MTNCYSALFFTLNMQIFSTALYSGIRRKDQEKREKIFRNICKVKNNPYLCTAFEKRGNSHEEFWRGGRVVDCGGLENRCTARYPGFESLSLRNKRWKSADCKTNTQFYTQECKVGVFVLFKIIQPLHNKRVAILKESDEKRLIFIYPFSLIFQDFTSSWKYLLLYSNVRSGL